MNNLFIIINIAIIIQNLCTYTLKVQKKEKRNDFFFYIRRHKWMLIRLHFYLFRHKFHIILINILLYLRILTSINSKQTMKSVSEVCCERNETTKRNI